MTNSPSKPWRELFEYHWKNGDVTTYTEVPGYAVAETIEIVRYIEFSAYKEMENQWSIGVDYINKLTTELNQAKAEIESLKKEREGYIDCKNVLIVENNSLHDLVNRLRVELNKAESRCKGFVELFATIEKAKSKPDQKE